MAALVAGMGGCGPGGGNLPPSQNLEIRDWYDLNAVRGNLAGNHTLMNDLDSTTTGYEELASPTANEGKGWEPIAALHPRYGLIGFEGAFDGQGYEIRDLFMNRPNENGVGLFGDIWQDGVIKDIGVMNVTVIGGESVGGLAGSIGGNVYNSYSSGNVTGDGAVGGLAGINDGTVSESYSTGSVTGDGAVGGLVGVNPGTVSNSYSSGNVTGGDVVGGLVGGNSGSVSNSYSSGNVIGDVDVGGLLRENKFDGTVSNSFWDIQTSGLTTSAGGTGRTTAEMQDIVTFSGAGWEICAVPLGATNPAYVWNIVDHETRPFLSWQPVSTPQSQEPIEIVSVLGPVGLPNPAGPIVEITLKNMAAEPVISLTATLEVFSALGKPFDFAFDDVSPSNPLQPDGSASDTRCLIGGGFSSNEWHFLKTHVTLQDGAEFVYTERVQIAEPS